MSHKYLKLADKFLLKDKNRLEETQKDEIRDVLWYDKNFIKYCLEQDKWLPSDHDKFKVLLDPPKNLNGYYKDTFGQGVSYKGIRTLKKSNTEINMSPIHINEINKCKLDFKYFRANYCLITTSKGLSRPELRKYQELLEDELLSLDDLVVLFPRQCISQNTNIIINNKPTTALDFFNICKNKYLQKTSEALPTCEKFIETYPTPDSYVSTPNGDVLVLEVHKTILLKKFKITLENGMQLDGAQNHVIINSEHKEIFIKDSLGIHVQTTSGNSKVIEVQDLEIEEYMYDISINSEDELYYSNGILSHNSGKTISSGTYLLWRALFHPDAINIGIVANKPKTAAEVLDKIKKIFLELPIWMKTGVEVWNRKEIEFENGTRIMTDGPHSDSFRGFTCVEGNTEVDIINTETLVEETITIRGLYERINNIRLIEVSDIW